MAPITLDMIRRRAEHNEGMVGNLEEIALHQQEIEKIEALGQIATSPNEKLVLMPLEAGNVIGALGGIAELAKKAGVPTTPAAR